MEKNRPPGIVPCMPHALYDRDYYLLNGSNFLYSLYGTMFIFLPAFLYTLHIREGQIGLIMATGTLVSVSLKPVNGLFVDRGGRTAFLVSGAYLAVAAPENRRGEALGVFGLSFFIPTALGGWLGEWMIGKAGFSGLFLSAAVIAFLAGLFPLGMEEPDRSSQLSVRSLLDFLSRTYFIPNTASFLFGTAYGSIFTFLPVFLLIRKISTIGVFVVVYALTVVGTRTLGRKLSDRLPRERLGLLSLLLLGIGILAIPFVRGPGGLAL